MKIVPRLVAIIAMVAMAAADAGESHRPPQPRVGETQIVTQDVDVTSIQKTNVDITNTSKTNVDVDVKNPVTVNAPVHVSAPVKVHTGPVTVPVTVNTGPTNVSAPVVNLGDTKIEGSRAELAVAEGALSPKAEAVGISGDVNMEGSTATAHVGPVTTGDMKNDIVVDDHSKNTNVTLVPPSTPSLGQAPEFSESADCLIEFIFQVQQLSGGTTQMPVVIKGKDLPVAKDVHVTMTSLADFPGIRKKPGKVSVVPVTANKVPEKGTYEAIALITIQAAGKGGHMLTPHELQIRAMQAAQHLNVSGDRPLYFVTSRKGMFQHATLVTTGSGWSVAPGAGGPIGDAIASVTGTLGRSGGTATNDWTPEVTGIVIRQKDGGGVTSGALAATEYALAATAQ